MSPCLKQATNKRVNKQRHTQANKQAPSPNTDRKHPVNQTSQMKQTEQVRKSKLVDSIAASVSASMFLLELLS